jgi:hypothetical protein
VNCVRSYLTQQPLILFCTSLLQYLKGNLPTFIKPTFRTLLVNNMTKTATSKKATKTAPTSNRANPALAPDNPRPRTPTRTGPDMVQLTPCHNEKTPSGSQPAAATKPRTRGDLRMSRTIPTASVRVPSPSSHYSKLSSRRNRARDPNLSRDDLTVTHLSPFEFMPR